MRVFVKNMRGEPLMPCSQRKARLLLKEGRAKIFAYNPFTIQLTCATGETVQPITVGIDTGAKMVGVAIVSEYKVLAKGEIELRQDISKVLKTRSELRRARRSHSLRYRKCRFLNRKRKIGWLPPSTQAKLNSTFFWIDKFVSLVPNPHLNIEVGKFDIQKMINPDISGADYQNGDTKGYYDVRYFVFARDKYTCQVCKKKGKILHTHHIRFRSCGGTDRSSNLISVCTECHSPENHKEGGVLYMWMQNSKKAPQYKDATFMNIVRRRTFERYPEAHFTYGSTTTPHRKELGLEKTHYNDAIAICGIKNVNDNPMEHFYYKQFRKKKRSLHEQTPRSRRSVKNITQERNRKNVKSRNGFTLNDEVLYGEKHCWVYGFACGENGKVCVVRDIDGVLQKYESAPGGTTIKMKDLRIACHNNGWQFAYIDTVANR